MQQTQPLTSRPQSAITSSPTIQAAPLTMQTSAADPAMTPIAIAALVLALGALVTAYLAFNASALPS